MKNYTKRILLYLMVLLCCTFMTTDVFAQGATCAQATQLCDDTACGTYTLGSGQGQDPIAGESSSCVGGDPNATWFFLVDDQGGGGTITITNTPAFDTDFVAWGPFDTPADALGACAGGISPANEVGCDFTTSPGGTITMPATSQVGDVYLMVITNFSDQSGIVVNVAAPPLICCPIPTGTKADVEICSGGTVTAALSDFEGSAGEITSTDQYISDLGLSTSATALVAPTAADFVNETCDPITLELFYLYDCDSDCDATGDTPSSAGSFNVTIYPDPTLSVAEVPGACGTAAEVTITAANGVDECFTGSGTAPSPPAACGTTASQPYTYNYTINTGQTCEQIYTMTIAADCDAPACVPGCPDPCFTEYDPTADVPDQALCTTPVAMTPCDDGDPCTIDDMEVLGIDGSTCTVCAGTAVTPPDPAFDCPASADQCGGLIALNPVDNATTGGVGSWSGSGAVAVDGSDMFDPSGFPVGATISLTYTIDLNGCMTSVDCSFQIVSNKAANAGSFTCPPAP